MKIAFSTLSCPDWSLNEIITSAKDLGFDGVSIRGLQNEMFVPNAPAFSDDEIKTTINKFYNANLEIPCLVTGCFLWEDDKKVIEEATKWINLASELSTPYIRLLGDEAPAPTIDIDIDIVKKNLKELAKIAKKKNVTLLVETNGIFANSDTMEQLMKDVNSKHVGVLWDSHHPYRFANETFEHTYNKLKKWIHHIQVKDSVIENGKVKYRLFRTGDLPVDELIKILLEDNYEGYISLEWVLRWDEDLEQPGVVLPHFKYTISDMIAAWQKDNLPDKGLWNITMGDMLHNIANKYPDHPAIIYGDQDFDRTYKEFDEETNRIARGLLSIGVKKGDHVAIWATNYPEWILAQFATAKIGAVLVTVNTNYKIFEAEYLLRQSDSSTLILMDGFKDTSYMGIIMELCPELETAKKGHLHSKRLPKLRRVIALDKSDKPSIYNWAELEELSKDVPVRVLQEVEKNLDPNDTINIQYTSGTTGFPKGVMLTHYNIVNNGKNIGDCLHLSKDDKLCIPVPFFHCFGCVLGILASVTHGTTMVPVDHYNPVKVMKAISDNSCTAVHGVPTMFIGMLSNKDFDKYDFSHLRTGIMAGSPCPESVMREVVDRMNMTEITIAYGQTEAAPVCTQTTYDDTLEHRVSTVGAALPYVECRVVDPETNEEVPIGIQGEFVARGYNIMKGYYNMPEATAQAIDKNGWLHTGDLATMDNDRYYKITGRIKDMIIRGGENIYPKEIEEFLYTQEGISDVQVVGIPDKQYGEEVGAFIIQKENANLSVEDVKDAVLKNMARHKVPKYIFFVNEFPLTASGKIQKYKLREMAAKELKLSEDDINATV